ncbi:hypothetical protein BX600DRAFT_470234 [Xylariales sp. PMI_506]|nr:hypothetical protein BX600DRAFT_470234 [Xylariales sp. PMI_506]
METTARPVREPAILSKFSQLPPELRSYIWELAVPVQNRFIDCPSFRKIKSAPCPVLFLVCKAAKSSVEKFYQRLRLCRRNCNLLMGKFVPLNNEKYRGVPISLDHDIFLIQNRQWWLWQTSGSKPAEEAMASRHHGKKFTVVCKRIEKFSTLGIRRVCVTCLDCKQDRGYRKAENDWIRALCAGCSDFCEMIFYRNARNGRDQEELDWSWQWTHRIEEVLYQRHDWDEARQVFPPKEHCPCSLCRPWSRMDRISSGLVHCAKPQPFDFKAHEALFKTSRELFNKTRE